jgi:hypothetical protein
LLTLTAIGKWILSVLTTRTACNASSGLVTWYALTFPELLNSQRKMSSPGAAAAAAAGAAVGAQPRGSPEVVPDLLLIASISLLPAGLLLEAAQLLMAALLHPAAPGTFLVAEASQQQQQQPSTIQAVFSAPGSAVAASCWPPSVLKLVLYHQQQQQQQQHLKQPASRCLPLTPLPLPLLVLSAAAAVTNTAQVPPELLAAVAAELIDVLLVAAPGSSSVTAAGWLCQVLRSSHHWHLWRPYVGKPSYLMQR